VWAKALAYCRQAGEKALARSAYREAVGYFDQALSALQHLPETRVTHEQAIDLRLALRTALFPSGDSGRILATLLEAEALAAALDDPRRLGQVSVFLSIHFHSRGAYAQSSAAAQRALTLAAASGEIVLHTLANHYLGRIYEAQGDYRQAIDCFRQTVASLDGARRYERFGQVILPAVSSRTLLVVCHAELGAFAEGRALAEEGRQIAETVDHLASRMYTSLALGLLALYQGDLHGALSMLERAISICQDANLRFYFPWLAATWGAAYTLGGRGVDAVPLLTQATAQATAMDVAYFETLCHRCLGEAQMQAGRLEEAHTLAERSLALARTRQERGHEAYALRLLGEIAEHRATPDVDEAAVHYDQTLALANELGMRPLQAHCHRGLGKLYSQTGHAEQARIELSTAIEMYREMEMTFWLPETEAALAAVEGKA
jgi:tetratricopeptide (TPR) repeat protein